MQLAARQRRLQHVAGVHRALGLAGADHRVQLVDEEDHATLLLRQVVKHALQALLELATELRARDQRAHVEREDALVFQALGHFAVDDALCETLDDRGLADARLTDQYRVVLGATLQHLDRAADLVVAADDRIELALLGPLGEIDREFLERLALFLGVGVGDLLAAAHFVDRLLHGALDHPAVAQDLPELALVLERREHVELARDVLVAALLRELVGQVQQLGQVVREVDLAARAFHLREVVDRLAELRAQPVDVGTRLVEQRPHRAALLVEQREHHVGGFDELVVAAERERLGVREGHLELAGQFVHAHGVPGSLKGLCCRLGWGRAAEDKAQRWPNSARDGAFGSSRLRLAGTLSAGESQETLLFDAFRHR